MALNLALRTRCSSAHFPNEQAQRQWCPIWGRRSVTQRASSKHRLENRCLCLWKIGTSGPEKLLMTKLPIRSCNHWIRFALRTASGLFCVVSANEALMRWQAGGAGASIHSASMRTPPLPAGTQGCKEEGSPESPTPRISGAPADCLPP